VYWSGQAITPALFTCPERNQQLILNSIFSERFSLVLINWSFESLLLQFKSEMFWGYVLTSEFNGRPESKYSAANWRMEANEARSNCMTLSSPANFQSQKSHRKSFWKENENSGGRLRDLTEELLDARIMSATACSPFSKFLHASLSQPSHMSGSKSHRPWA
jgi:hypothetical protein